jgi:broad specificity phosphatase PhoE
MEGSGIIYLVRHCAVPNDQANYPALCGRDHDVRLTADGLRQSAAVVEFLHGKGVGTIYTSPALCAIQTARHIMQRAAGSLVFCSSLAEVDFGDWEGLDRDTILKQDADVLAAHERDPGTYGFPGGESLSQVGRRVMAFLEGVAAQHRGERTVVISHHYVCCAVLALLMGVPLHRIREVDQDPGCVNVIRVFRGGMTLQAVNYTDNFETAEAEEEQDEDCIQLSVPSGCCYA